MDPVSLATSAAALLAPYLLRGADRAVGNLADSATDATVAKVKQLYQWLQGALAGKRADQALSRLERDPANDDYRVAFQVELADVIESESRSDPDFAVTLERLVEEARRAGGMSLTQITDAGAVAGRDVNLRGRNVAGRDMVIGNPPTADGGE
ncbi:MAG TPA: hypothetical protein VJ735_17740 [Actinomycetes bacterium]|nr:hypothetical protein [Actinomycetes bacterium]